MGKGQYTIGVDKKTREEINLLKIKMKKRSSREVVQLSIKLLKQYLRK